MIKKKTTFLMILIALNTIILSLPYEYKIFQDDLFNCTIVMTAREGLILAGNNKDRNHPETKVTFIPATEKYNGRIVFGFDDSPIQGGMNDKGLFMDGNSVSPTNWQPEPGKPTFNGSVILFLLGTCATCDEVRHFFEKHNVPGLERARFPVADRTGASMVVEYGQGKTQFITSDTWYLISTNFIMSDIKNKNYPCWRYITADKLFSDADELNLEIIRKVLEETSQEGGSLTVYSNIYDLKKRIIYLYNMRNFEDPVVMDLAKELDKGQRQIDLSSLFETKRNQPSLSQKP
jgi:penicillin V acylase-like amidase (Ntn superfamily)